MSPVISIIAFCFCVFEAVSIMRILKYFAVILLIAHASASFAKEAMFFSSISTGIRDSIGVEIVNNKQVIIHRLEPKETYYGLSKNYGVALSDLIAFNNNKALKIGETIRIPTNREVSSPQTTPTNSGPDVVAQSNPQPQAEPEPEIPHVQLAPGEYTNYKVGKGETLYTVSRRFNVPVESIKLANGLAGDGIQEGQTLQVPKKALPPIEQPVVEVEPAILASSVIDTTVVSVESLDLPKNRYGIREMNEKGLGVWIEDLNQDGATMLALHKTVPVGTVVKVTNPMTNLSTFVKVVGKFMDTADTQGAIIVLSKSVASIIGILDRRFQIEIAYGAPVEEEPK